MTFLAHETLHMLSLDPCQRNAVSWARPRSAGRGGRGGGIQGVGSEKGKRQANGGGDKSCTFAMI
jgi:hypothetical protein